MLSEKKVSAIESLLRNPKTSALVATSFLALLAYEARRYGLEERSEVERTDHLGTSRSRTPEEGNFSLIVFYLP